MQFDVLAIMGRGIQMDATGMWHPTADLEMYDVTGGNPVHDVHAAPPDDTSERCLIGGGELNLLAGVELYKKYGAHIVVCAYGEKPGYLAAVDGPTENEILTKKFVELLKGVGLPQLPVWFREWDHGQFNTDRELENVFTLARERDLWRIGVITVNVHLPRTMMFGEKHWQKRQFQHLKIRYFPSETVLLNADPGKYAMRMLAQFTSKAFQRSAAIELRGVGRLLDGTYYSKK